MLAGLGAHFHELRLTVNGFSAARAEAILARSRFTMPPLTVRDEGFDLAGAVVLDLDLLEGLVGAAETEGGEVGDAHNNGFNVNQTAEGAENMNVLSASAAPSANFK